MKMSRKKRDKLKSLIQKVELDEPSHDFTGLVMEEVKAQKEAVINPALKSLLKRNGIEIPSIDFTQSIMTLVEAHDFQPTDKPIISKKVWLIIIYVVVFFALHLGSSEQTLKSPYGLTTYFIRIGNKLNTVLTNVNSVPSLYLITFISLSALLVMDYLLRIRSQSHGTKPRAL
jgi:hypothetical protein